MRFTYTPRGPLTPDPELRQILLDYRLDNATTPELNEWLTRLGQNTKGSVIDRIDCIRQHTGFLATPCEAFPQLVLDDLDRYTTDHLADLCHLLGLPTDGDRDARWRRILRAAGQREGWLPAPTSHAFDIVRAYVEWHLIAMPTEEIHQERQESRTRHRRGLHAAFTQEMTEVFGADTVHPQHRIAPGSLPRIDFHIGRRQETENGIGIEFTMPTSDSERTRALARIAHVNAHYTDRLIVVLFPDPFDPAQRVDLFDERTRQGVAAIVK